MFDEIQQVIYWLNDKTNMEIMAGTSRGPMNTSSHVSKHNKVWQNVVFK